MKIKGIGLLIMGIYISQLALATMPVDTVPKYPGGDSALSANFLKVFVAPDLLKDCWVEADVYMYYSISPSDGSLKFMRAQIKLIGDISANSDAYSKRCGNVRNTIEKAVEEAINKMPPYSPYTMPKSLISSPYIWGQLYYKIDFSK